MRQKKAAFFLVILIIYMLLPANSCNLLAGNMHEKKDKDYKKNYRIAREYYETGMYRDALRMFLQLIKQDPANSNLNFYIGICYLELSEPQSKALPYFEKAAETTVADHFNSTAQENAPVYSYYFLADIYLSNYKFNEALQYYEKFRMHLTDKHREKLTEVNTQIERCKNAIVYERWPIQVEMEEINDLNERVYDDAGVQYTRDGKKMFFTRRRKLNNGHYACDIYYRTKSGSDWNRPRSLARLNSKVDDILCYVSPDGKEIYLSSNRDGNYDIYYSYHISRSNWSKPEKLPEGINSAFDEVYAFPDMFSGNMYFVSNREGGYGKHDIYYAKILKHLKYSTINNAGNLINTSFDENYPSFSEDGKMMFFSSRGHQNSGGYDIYFAYRNGQKWTKPENIGYPINTPVDDEYFVYFRGENPCSYSCRETDQLNKHIVKNILQIDFKKHLKPQKKAKEVKKSTQNPALPINYKASTLPGTQIKYTYSIQVGAGKIENTYFSRLGNVKSCIGSDGIIRYFYGRYRSKEEAERQLEFVVRAGYAEAWVCPINSKHGGCLGE